MSKEANLDNPDCGFKAMTEERTTIGGVVNPPAYHQIVFYPVTALVSDILGDQKLVIMKRRYLHLVQVSILLESFPVKQMKALAFSTGTVIYSAVVFCGLWLGRAERTSAVNVS